jgi:hypothetical protein
VDGERVGLGGGMVREVTRFKSFLKGLLNKKPSDR